MQLVLQSLAALVLGALLVLGFAPFNYWWAYTAALVAFTILLQYQSPGVAAWLGLLLGVGQFGIGTSWVYVSIYNFSAAGSGTASALTALLVLYQALFIALACWLYAKLSHKHLKQSAHHQSIIPALLLFGSLWLLAEIPRSHLLNGFPWLLTGYAFFDTPLTGWGKLGGVSATGAAAILIVVLLSFIVQRAPLLGLRAVKMRSLLALLAIGLLLVTGGALRDTLRWRPLSDDGHTFALIQGNINQADKWRRDKRGEIVARYERLLEQAWQRSDVIVLPEVALPFHLHQNYDWYQSWQQRALEDNKTLVVGVLTADSERRNYNSVLGLGGEGDFTENIYHKKILVPFGEYLPLPPGLSKLVRNLANFSMSAGPPDQAPLISQHGTLAPLVCYEIAFDAYTARQARAANAIVTISNDSWFGRSLGPEQHAQIARMRSIENETYVLRTTSTGISFASDPSGKVISSIEPWQEGIAYGKYFKASTTDATPFSRYGFWPIYCLLLLIAATSATALRQGSASSP